MRGSVIMRTSRTQLMSATGSPSAATPSESVVPGLGLGLGLG